MDPYERTDWCEECGETYADCGCDETELRLVDCCDDDADAEAF